MSHEGRVLIMGALFACLALLLTPVLGSEESNSVLPAASVARGGGGSISVSGGIIFSDASVQTTATPSSVIDGTDWMEVTGIPSGFADDIDDVADADADATNELISSASLDGTLLTIAEGASQVSVDLGSLGQGCPTFRFEMLTFDGSSDSEIISIGSSETVELVSRSGFNTGSSEFHFVGPDIDWTWDYGITFFPIYKGPLDFWIEEGAPASGRGAATFRVYTECAPSP